MVCHGDRGQGLTEEWRNAGDPADANCWQSRCHASNHPPDGFELPRYAPPLIGEYALARFATIGDIQEYIQLSMPWHLPGFLEEEQYQQIAVYLAHANGAEGLNAAAGWAEIAISVPTSHTQGTQPVVNPTAPDNARPQWKENQTALILGVLLLIASGISWKRRRA